MDTERFAQIVAFDAQIYAEHRRSGGGPSRPSCTSCGQEWPCHAVRAADAILDLGDEVMRLRGGADASHLADIIAGKRAEIDSIPLCPQPEYEERVAS